MDLTLIPFGLDVRSEQLVDVYEVPGGRQCQCVCPSCRLPLIARHGSTNVWHFAHETRDATGASASPCRYSFYLSVRMMARQLLETDMRIDVPELRGEVAEVVKETGQTIRQPYLVTSARTIYLENVRAGESLGGVAVDIIGEVAGYKLALYLTDPERSAPSALTMPEEGKCGVITLRLDDVKNQFRTCDRSRESYKSILTRHISVGAFSKKWIYHPRHQAIRETAKEEVLIKVKEAQAENHAHTVRIRTAATGKAQAKLHATEESGRNVREKKYKRYCLLCGHQWMSEARREKDLHCPNCGKRGCIS